MKKSMRPDNNNLDAIAKQARQPIPKAMFGIGKLFKGIKQGRNNYMESAGKIIGGDPMGGISQQTGLPPEQLAQIGMKAGMAAAGVPPIGKKGGSVKMKKKC
jgi:hypothetical protein